MKVRQNSEPKKRVAVRLRAVATMEGAGREAVVGQREASRSPAYLGTPGRITDAVGDEDVAEAPDRLDEARVAGSGSISLRRREICTSGLRSNTSYSRPRAISISFSRDSGWRGWRANTFSTENSPVVRVISSSFLVSVRVAG